MTWVRDAAIAAVSAVAASGAAAAVVTAGAAKLSRRRGDDPQMEDADMRAWERENGS
jgi:hypothetical protein